MVFGTGEPIAQVARLLGVNEGTLGNWVTIARREHPHRALAGLRVELPWFRHRSSPLAGWTLHLSQDGSPGQGFEETEVE